MAKTAKNILSLNHEKTMDFFMKSEQYDGFELQVSLLGNGTCYKCTNKRFYFLALIVKYAYLCTVNYLLNIKNIRKW